MKQKPITKEAQLRAREIQLNRHQGQHVRQVLSYSG